jgi:hypothetical protein
VLETGKDQFGKDLAGQPRLCAVWVHRTVRWCTRQCPVRQASSGELAALGFRRRRTAINHRTVRWCTNGSESPTVGFAKEGKKSAPDSVRWCTGLSGGAPDCPVRQATEGKNCLHGMLSMAPSCLGAIKGTPRRMEEDTKHSLSIPKHQDSNSAHSFLCDSN